MLLRAWVVGLIAALLTAAPQALAEAPFSAAPTVERPRAAAPLEEQASVTRHSISVNGRRIAYEATAGTLTLRDGAGTPTASMFYVAYVAERPRGAPERPITFFYNGGPGSSSIWLHMGSFGPVRAPLIEPGQTLAAPYRITPNQYTMLDQTDMVFLDAVGTGYSRTFDEADNRLYWGNDQDSQSFVRGILRYIERTDRWNAPKFLFGESYGGMRSAIVADRLHERGVDVNGVVLLSPVLNFANLASGMDQWAINLVPTYAATAWHHGRMARDSELEAVVEQARQFARGPYAAALAKGHTIGDAERDAVAARLSQVTGLSADYLIRSNLRVESSAFRRELLRDQEMVLGGSDTRFSGMEENGVGERASYDPAHAATAGAYTAAFMDYLGRTLQYRSDLDYRTVDQEAIMGAWDWSHQPPNAERQISMANVILDLGSAMRQNPSMRVLALNGYYDLTTPFFATEYDLAHLHLAPSQRANLTFRYYASGHMLYVDEAVLRQLRRDVGDFYRDTLSR